MEMHPNRKKTVSIEQVGVLIVKPTINLYIQSDSASDCNISDIYTVAQIHPINLFHISVIGDQTFTFSRSQDFNARH